MIPVSFRPENIVDQVPLWGAFVSAQDDFHRYLVAREEVGCGDSKGVTEFIEASIAHISQLPCVLDSLPPKFLDERTDSSFAPVDLTPEFSTRQE